VQEGHIGCLTWTADGIFVCTNQETRGFEIGVTRDEGATLESLALQNDVEGPLQCPPGTPTGDFCENAWPFTCELIQKCMPVVRPDPPVDAGAPGVTEREAEGGCACAAARRSGGTPFFVVLVTALFAVAGLRRRLALQ
jgi:MYXO-CTERM domain-containing protein